MHEHNKTNVKVQQIQLSAFASLCFFFLIFVKRLMPLISMCLCIQAARYILLISLFSRNPLDVPMVVQSIYMYINI